MIVLGVPHNEKKKKETGSHILKNREKGLPPLREIISECVCVCVCVRERERERERESKGKQERFFFSRGTFTKNYCN